MNPNRALSVIVVPDHEGGLSAAVTSMIYHTPNVPSIEDRVDNLVISDMEPNPSDDDMPAWLSVVLRKVALQLELHYAAPPDSRAVPFIADPLPFD